MPTELLFSKIVIIGAGTMGRGIAQVCAMAGYATVLNDISSHTLAQAQQQIERNLQKVLNVERFHWIRNKLSCQSIILHRVH